MLRRPPSGPYLEDGPAELELGNDPDLDDLRAGDVLLNSSTWAKNNAVNNKSPQGRNLVCMDGAPVGVISEGGNVAVNCRHVSSEVGAILVGLRRPQKEDKNLMRPGVNQVLSRLKSHIGAALDTFFISGPVEEFLSGACVLGIRFPKSKFQGIGLDGHYKDFLSLGGVYTVLDYPQAHDVSAQQYLGRLRVKWLIDLRLRIESYVRSYMAAHLSCTHCYVCESGTKVDFNDAYLPKMILIWDYENSADITGQSPFGLRLRAQFLARDAKEFVLHGVKFAGNACW